MKNIFLAILLMPLISFAQEQTTYPRDTTYSANSVYKKLHKQHPYIEIVYPNLPQGVVHKKEMVYRTIGERKLHVDVFHQQQQGATQPVLLLIHGGGWRTGDKSLMFPLAEQL